MTGETRKKRPGRPTLRTEPIRDIILASLARCPVPDNACRVAGISRKTYDRWRRDDEKFCLETDRLLGVEVENLYEKVKDSQPWKLLKNIAKEHFKEHVEIQLSEEEVDVDSDNGTTTI